MIAIINILFGSYRDFPLGRRIFNAVSILNGITNLVGAIGLYVTMGEFFLLLWQTLFGVIFILFYYCSRFTNYFAYLFWPFVLSILVFLFVNIIFNAGLSGGAHYYLIPALIISIVISDSWKKTLSAAILFILSTASIIYLEVNYPQIFTRFDSDQAQFADMSGNFLFVQIFTALLVIILSQGLRQESYKSDKLLRSILPEEVAEELKKKDHVSPVSFHSATVLFTDFINFTESSKNFSPNELIQQLDSYFSDFDAISEKYNLEKIKTIGDAYMASGGIPAANNTHPVDCVMAALEFQHLINIRSSEMSDPNCWKIRVGVHTGNLIAGVIGREKFAYDVWGDTVNTASRLESSSEAGKVNISEDTYRRIEEFFECVYRGRIAVKGKGEIPMYFVTGIKSDLSYDGLTPNQKFKDMYKRLAEKIPSEANYNPSFPT